MIPMTVGNQEMVLIAALLDELIPQPPDARTGIHDDDVITPGADLYTGGVTAVLQIFFS